MRTIVEVMPSGSLGSNLWSERESQLLLHRRLPRTRTPYDPLRPFMEEKQSKIRKWTETEITSMVNVIKARRPELWEELKRLERAGGELGVAGGQLTVLIEDTHPSVSRWDRLFLLADIRNRLRQELGSK
jgi:hypothetical protein